MQPSLFPAPPLEEALSLAAAVGAPQVASTRRAVAAVAGPMVAATATPDAASPVPTLSREEQQSREVVVVIVDVVPCYTVRGGLCHCFGEV